MALEVANPYLGGAGVEVQSALFVDFGARIGRGNNLNTDLWCALEEGETANVLGTLRGEPGNIDNIDRSFLLGPKRSKNANLTVTGVLGLGISIGI